MARREKTGTTELPASPKGRLTDEELLARAAELVARGWSREARAEDGLGRPVGPYSESARRWSPVGALQKVWSEGGGGRLEVFETAYLSLMLATGGRLDAWNAAPWRTRWHVLRAFERARKNLPQAREQLQSRH